jgi:hypothetical protein
MMNNAIKGTASGQRTYRDPYREAVERVAQLEPQEAKDLERYKDTKQLTEDELKYFPLIKLWRKKRS